MIINSMFPMFLGFGGLAVGPISLRSGSMQGVTVKFSFLELNLIFLCFLIWHCVFVDKFAYPRCFK